MLYSNIPVRADMNEIFIGLHGPNRLLMRVESQKGVELRCSTNYAYSISFKNPLSPEIRRDYTSDICLLLSTQGTLSYDYPGAIHVLAKHKSQLEYKTGRSSDENYSWPCALIKVSNIDTIIEVRSMGASVSQLLLVLCNRRKDLIKCSIKELEQLCESLKIEVPCSIIKSEKGIIQFEDSEWVDL